MAMRQAGLDIPNIWAVEQTKGADVYSNGLQIENRLAVTNEPRLYPLVRRESDGQVGPLSRLRGANIPLGKCFSRPDVHTRTIAGVKSRNASHVRFPR
jgi:hypothetical protein